MQFTFYETQARDILLDMKSRENIDDSTLIILLVMLDISKNYISEQQFAFNSIYYEDSDSIPMISNYRDDYFCINDSSFKNFRRPRNQKLKLSIEELLYSKVDTSNNNVLWYFLTEELNTLNPLKESYKEILNGKGKVLYAIYTDVDAKHNILRRIISLDSLRYAFNFDRVKSNIFYSKDYFNDLESASRQLYDGLLKPFEQLINPAKSLKLILPNALISIPLDYVYSKVKGKLPYFVEYGSLYRAALVAKNIKFDRSDSANIFSEMIYHDMYCNLNKAPNYQTRGSIVPLENSKKERLAIQETICSRSYTGSAASKENFVYCLLNNNTSIVHLITHGAYIPNYISQDSIQSQNSNARKAFIKVKDPLERQLLLFSSDSSRSEFGSSKNNILCAFECQYFEDLSNIKLIFLSACETGLIEVEETQKSGYSGFVNNFLERGVKFVIATRWKVNDSYAADFATLYYKNLEKYKDFQLAFYDTKKYFFNKKASPGLWASYVFVR
jgi:CHAT domain-containing protein